jgi:hypothetical protein
LNLLLFVSFQYLFFYFTTVLFYFFWSVKIIDSSTLNVQNWVPIKPVQRAMSDMFHIFIFLMYRRNQTESAIFIIYCCDQCFRGFTFYTDFILNNRRCQVLCGSVPRFSVVIFFWSFGIIYFSTFKCWKLSTVQAGARG